MKKMILINMKMTNKLWNKRIKYLKIKKKLVKIFNKNLWKKLMTIRNNLLILIVLFPLKMHQNNYQQYIKKNLDFKIKIFNQISVIKEVIPFKVKIYIQSYKNKLKKCLMKYLKIIKSLNNIIINNWNS